MTNIPIRLNIVVAPPGARGDFLAGWLGTLDNTVDTDWRLDAVTGRSFGSMNLIKDALANLEKFNLTLTQILSNVGYKLSADADTVLTVSCHRIGIDFSPGEIAAIKMIQVMTDQSDCETCNWEFIVKTFLCKERFESSYRFKQNWNVDRDLTKLNIEITDSNRINYIKQTASVLNIRNNINFVLDQFNPTQIPYKLLLSETGSYKIANLLGIQPSDRNHATWKSKLVLADSPDQIIQFGHVWNKDNYWK